MLIHLRLGLALTLALGACGGADRGGGVDARPPAPDDEDGDTISDDDEGRGADVDTDNDGTPDYLDDDSDGDGVPDYREAGDEDPSSNPFDSDSDGTPDFRDTDSDDNGIADGDDGVDDIDGDGKGNFQDLDDDGDTMNDEFEIGDDPGNPVDTDTDGTPDYQDLDSDGDTIADAQERASDPDMDMVPAYQDLDSDNDCIVDADEAGDTSLSTLPPDGDMDGKMDPLDLDSDNDGLADGDEDGNCNGIQDSGESSPTDADSDGDGVTDLVEQVAGTDPTNPADNPQANGDFFFLVPYQMPTDPPEDTLEFRTSVQFADLYFQFDTTTSMSTELSSMAASTGVPKIVDDLSCDPAGVSCTQDSDCPVNNICFNNDCVADPNFGNGCVPDLYTGIGTFDEKNTYRNRLSVQPNAATTAANIPGTGTGSAEAPIQAAACVGDPSLCTNASIACAAAGIGCPGFRSSAVRILVFITDADQQCNTSTSPTAPCYITTTQAGDALEAQGIKFVGLWGTGDSGGTSDPETIQREIGIASGTVDTAMPPQPFVYPAEDSAVVQSTEDAVIDIVRGLPLDVTIGAADQPADDGDALQFIDHLQVNLSGGACTNVSPTDDNDGDGYQDEFPSLLPGTPVCWDVVPIAQNDTVPATGDPQLFVARLTVYGDGSPLDSRDVFFLIPPVIDDVPIN